MKEQQDDGSGRTEAVESTTESVPAEEYPTGKRLAPILLALLCAVFLIALDMTIIGTAIPKITADFDGLSMVSWYGSAYFMTFGGFQPMSGKLYKYFPLKPSFLAMILVFVIGSLICGVAQNSTTFVVGRAIAGMGAAGIATGAFTIVVFTAEPRIRAGLIGFMGAMYGLSSVVGPILGGVFTDKATWRWCFYINLPVGALCSILIVAFFKTPRHAMVAKATWREKLLQMDPIGVTFVMAGIITFITAVEYGGQKHPWKSSLVIGLFVGSFLSWTAFAIWEYYNQERAMLQGSLLRQRSVWQPAIFQFFFSASYYVVLYYLPIYFQSVDGRSAISSGVLNLPLVISMAVGSTVSGVIVSKTGHAAPFMVGGAVLATVSCGLIYTFDVDTSMGKWVGYQVLYGAVIGMAFQMAITIAQGHARIEHMSSVTATLFFFQTTGAAYSVAAAQSGFVNRIVTELAKSTPSLDPDVVIATGATQIRQAFAPEFVPAVVTAYMAGIKITFALSIALVGVTCLLAICVPRKQINAEVLPGSAA